MVAIEEPPFEVTETGWGEFEIQIKVHFTPEASEKPMTLFHFLHLHPYGPNKDEEKEKGLTVDAFQYEEIVHSLLQNVLSLIFFLAVMDVDGRFLEIRRIRSLMF
jgi:transcription initiation factor IIF auxiliary subunit